MRLRSTAALAASAIIAPLASAGVTTFDFESLVHGEIVTTQYAPLLTISAVNPNRGFDIAAAFDTSLMGTSDPDLQGPPWAGGNLAISQTETQLGRALIIAENNLDADFDGILDDPDDEGSRPAGQLIFDFSTNIHAFGFDVIDIEGNVMEFSRLEFFNGDTLVGSVGFDEFTTVASTFYDASIVFGDNTANRISPITSSLLAEAGFDGAEGGFNRVIIYAGGSSAYDNITIPAPSGVLAIAGGWLMLSPRRRRG